MQVKVCLDAYETISKVRGKKSISEVQVSPNLIGKNIADKTELFTIHSVPFFANPKLKKNEIIAILDCKEVFIRDGKVI